MKHAEEPEDGVLVDGGLEILSEETAMRLLCASVVGRVAVTIGALPAIFPVNYTVIDGDIVFRTAPGTKFSAATDGAVVAFEVDDYSRTDPSGWSVLAVGRSMVENDRAFAARVAESELQPYAHGPRPNIVRITPSLLSGRRITRPPGTHPSF